MIRVDDLRPFVDDFHTHIPNQSRAIINILPGENMEPGYMYSCGIHPWSAATASENDFKALHAALSRPEAVAVGECGLDRLRGPEIEIQQPVFVRQLQMAEEAGKPVIIHCVRANDILLQLRKKLNPSVDWIYHGFRGKPEAARQLTDAGIYLSLGTRYNPAVAEAINPRYILRESDAGIPTDD